MSAKAHYFNIWPTRVLALEFTSPERRDYDEELIQTALSFADLSGGVDMEARIHNFHANDTKSIDWLLGSIRRACQDYIGAPLEMTIGLRAVAIKTGQHINTHTETHESDLMVVYWPQGDDVSKDINSNADRSKAPTFLLEDPSRHLTDLRLPFERRHSVHIAPRAGLMLIAPAHMPHNLWPYQGETPFIHIVAQVRIEWPDEYENRW